MSEQRAPPTLVLSLLFAAIFLTMTVYLMLAPLLVELAAEFHTSVAVTGQLVAATAITWAISAPLVGPLSDTYGRRPVVLAGLMPNGVRGLEVSPSMVLRLYAGIPPADWNRHGYHSP